MDDMKSTEDPSAETDPGRGRRFRRNIVALGAAAGLTLGGLGIAAAQTPGDNATNTVAARADGARKDGPRHPGLKPGLEAAAKALGMSEEDLKAALKSGKSLAEVAREKGVDPKVVIDALVAEAKAKMGEAVKAGRLTQEQADQRMANLEARITEMVNNAGHPGKDRPGKRGHRGPKPNLEAAAKAIGISEDELKKALESGQSIAQVAQAKGVDVNVVVKAMVADATANLEKRITEMVNEPGGRGPGPGGPGKRRP